MHKNLALANVWTSEAYWIFEELGITPSHGSLSVTDLGPWTLQAVEIDQRPEGSSRQGFHWDSCWSAGETTHRKGSFRLVPWTKAGKFLKGLKQERNDIQAYRGRDFWRLRTTRSGFGMYCASNQRVKPPPLSGIFSVITGKKVRERSALGSALAETDSVGSSLVFVVESLP